MVNLKLVRHTYGTATLGKLFVNDVFFCHTLEDKIRYQNGDYTKKVKNETCIDAGKYKVVLTQSNRFKRILPELLNVPCFTAIRIHGGNTTANTEGCILLGADTNGIDRISNCSGVVNGIIEKIKGKECTIEIVNGTKESNPVV